MQAKDLKRYKLPDAPGVYFFLGPRRSILYIGKATSLRDRIRSYFSRDVLAARGPAILKMVHEAAAVDFKQTDSVLEALILEANLIRKHQPVHNVREKDDKSFNYVVITREEWPRVLVVRGRDLEEKFPTERRKYLFGPFPRGLMFKEAMRLIRKFFPYYDTAYPVADMRGRGRGGRLAFNRAIGLYPPDTISKAGYAKTIQHIRLFLEGKKPQLLTRLEKEMKSHAKREEFEAALRLKRIMFGLTHIQDISLLKREVRELSAARGFRIEAYDMAHISGTASVGVMVVVEDGEVSKSNYRTFRIKGAVAGSDTGALEEVLSRRLKHDEWLLPNLIVVDGGKQQINMTKRVLKEFGYRIPVISVVKDERHRPRSVVGKSSLGKERENDVILANTEAHRFALRYHRKVRKG